MLSLRFAADGRRTSNKIGTVMAEFSLIEEKENDSDHQYCVDLCNSKLYLSFVDYKGAEVTCITDAYLYIKQSAKMTWSDTDSLKYCYLHISPESGGVLWGKLKGVYMRHVKWTKSIFPWHYQYIMKWKSYETYQNDHQKNALIF